MPDLPPRQEKPKHFYQFRCTQCEAVVPASCERPLKDSEQAELAARMECPPCVKKKLDAKK